MTKQVGLNILGIFGVYPNRIGIIYQMVRNKKNRVVVVRIMLPDEDSENPVIGPHPLFSSFRNPQPVVGWRTNAKKLHTPRGVNMFPGLPTYP